MKYEKPEMDVTKLETEDVIRTSIIGGEETFGDENEVNWGI